MDAVAVMEMRMDGGRPAPSSGWFVQERSTKPMKEVATAVGSGNVYVNKAAAADAGAANNKAVAGTTKVEAGATNKAVAVAVAGGKRRTKTMRVQQAYIDSLLEEYPFQPLRPIEVEKSTMDPVRKEILRDLLASAGANLKACRDKDEAIIKQYLALGYAEEEVEVEDDEEA